MGILSDRQIRDSNCITPFEPGMKRDGKISYGLSSYGYDVRAGYKFKVFTNVWNAIVDPKDFDEKSFVDFDLTPPFPSNYIVIPPNSFALAETLETITVPRDCLCIVLGKSTYARCGIVLNCTPLEPEWTGKVVLEVSNTTPLPAKIYAGEGIGQVLFFRSDEKRNVIEGFIYDNLADVNNIKFLTEDMAKAGCETSYADKAGRYQGQTGIVLPKVD